MVKSAYLTLIIVLLMERRLSSLPHTPLPASRRRTQHRASDDRIMWSHGTTITNKLSGNLRKPNFKFKVVRAEVIVSLAVCLSQSPLFSHEDRLECGDVPADLVLKRSDGAGKFVFFPPWTQSNPTIRSSKENDAPVIEYWFHIAAYNSVAFEPIPARKWGKKQTKKTTAVQNFWEWIRVLCESNSGLLIFSHSLSGEIIVKWLNEKY